MYLASSIIIKHDGMQITYFNIDTGETFERNRTITPRIWSTLFEMTFSGRACLYRYSTFTQLIPTQPFPSNAFYNFVASKVGWVQGKTS